MTKPRKTNKSLPHRVYIKDGAYRFLSKEKIVDPRDGVKKFWIKLAGLREEISVMYCALSKLLEGSPVEKTSMVNLCNEFKANKLSSYSKETQKTYARYLDKIATDFQDFRISQVTPMDFHRFLRNNFAGKYNTCKKVVNLAEKLFKYGSTHLEWLPVMPLDQLDISDFKTKRRKFLATHRQVEAIRSAGMLSTPHKKTGATFSTLSGPMFGCIVDMTYLCWMRAIDVRMMKESQIINGSIRFTASKTRETSGMVVDIAITPTIQEVMDRARAIKKKHGVVSEYIFANKDGVPYSKSGLTSMWERARQRAGRHLDVKEVQFRDLRSLGATDAALAGTLRDDIRIRLSHTSADTTDLYIKQAIPEKSDLNLALPWSSSNAETERAHGS